MYLVAIAWMYVVLMMSIVEALSPQGTVLGALFTFVLYGLLPMGIVMYLLGTPMRRRARIAAESSGPGAPDAGGHAAGQPVAPERKEP
jgi:mannose/fructose/N-acetylgalactosamine-specific phosphotransferase system component IID